MKLNPRDIAELDLGIFDDIALELLEGQPWWKKFSNTVTTAIWSVLNVIWLVVSLGIALPEPVVFGVAVLVLLANVLGVKRTPNGYNPQLLEGIKARLGETRLSR